MTKKITWQKAWVASGGNEMNSSDEIGDGTTRLRGARVLLVEDNEIIRMLMLDLLTDYGISVEVANNGRDALSLLESIQVDVVLMDCQMPVMDGYAATRKIRERPGFKHLPVIALTANSMANDHEKVLAVGMNDYIAKPVNIKNLLRTMAKWITPGITVKNTIAQHR